MSLVHASALAVFELRGDIPTFEGEFWLAAYREQLRSLQQLTRSLEDWQHFLDAWCRRRACDWEPLADGEPCFEQGDIERLEQQGPVQLPTCQNCAVLVDMATVCGQERKSVL